MSAYRSARVYVLDEWAGVLEETDAGYRFAYVPTYLDAPNPLPVSLTLPPRSEPYLSTTLFSFFDGLIPEGWLLDVVAHNWKLARSDRFGLLLAACRDCIGNVSVRPTEVSE